MADVTPEEAEALLAEMHSKSTPYSRRKEIRAQVIAALTRPAPQPSEGDAVEAAAMAMHEGLHPSQTPWAVAPESWRESYRKQARVAFDVFSRLATSRVPEGWQLVPKEPTVGMIEAVGLIVSRPPEYWRDDAAETWKAMLAAAPKPEGG